MIIAIFILFLILFLFPPITSYVYYKTHKTEVLRINQEYIKDPRYFAKSFSKMVEERLPSAKDHIITLSHDEQFYDEKDLEKLQGTVDRLVLSKGSITVKKNINQFNKEIYCAKDSIFDVDGLQLRAVYGKSRLLLGNGISVIRWVDASESLSVYDHCDLGISASAGKKMCVGYDCSFKRLYAPQIYLGYRPGQKIEYNKNRNSQIYLMSPHSERLKNIRYINKKRIDENGVCDYSVISWSNVTLTENVILKGNIRSHKGVRICKNAVVIGNIFSEYDVILEEGSLVLGNILSQGTVHIEKGAVIGQDGCISSIIARENVQFAGMNIVYGYVSCERGGKVCEKADKSEKIEELIFESVEHEMTNISFGNIEEYVSACKKGFRKNDGIQSIEIPEGATGISKSLCYHCDNLKRVILPKTTDTIEDYAFADCEKIADITGFEELALRRIGISAFENDVNLKVARFPDCLEEIEAAAFAGCSGLQEISFTEKSGLRALGDHCFRGCSNVKQITLPDGVEKVGISCFSGCSKLERISAPKSIQEQPGMVQLQEMMSDVTIEFR